MISNRSIWKQALAILMMVVFAGFTFLQDAHYLLEDHHTEQEECTDRSTEHYHQDYADDHCKLCFISQQSFEVPENFTDLPNYQGLKSEDSLEGSTIINLNSRLPYSLRAPPF